ncbi:WxL domain-containing protein [Candidatus Enterococcus mansonii]|uniref:WxL domain-containing protein n=1 Tax=Candidatus Enterococcus mansonii TaxID=1834181 RepID=A0A242CDV8_9ENTE|nr:WxL domain-containing protein [Enterococcus sp. 4G2_DIV0659]OTO08444.1 hypothetical protein A5880_001444 [Enterococcus sp. 4G2_DIV0659]
MVRGSRIVITLLLLLLLFFGIETKVFARETVTNGTINFYPDESKVDPIDPTDTKNDIYPNQLPIASALSLSYVSDLSFGTHATANHSQEFFATPDKITDKNTNHTKQVPNFVQLTDKTGKNLGWELTVAQSKPLTNERGFALENTRFIFRNIVLKGLLPEANSPIIPEQEITLTKVNQPVLIARAAKETGQGTWFVQFGKEGNEAAKSISLYIPGKVKKEPGSYNTTLTWTLTNSL